VRRAAATVGEPTMVLAHGFDDAPRPMACGAPVPTVRGGASSRNLLGLRPHKASLTAPDRESALTGLFSYRGVEQSLALVFPPFLASYERGRQGVRHRHER
jgi:hypothetical protein